MNLGYDSNPSGYDEDAEDNPAALRPMNNVAFTDVRGPHDETTSPVPGISSLDEGTFFQRLNFVTGNRFAFDLPTEVMFEMAERAGTRTVYYWGDEMDTNYVVCAENSGGLPQPVGSRLPNAWGLYDMAGNLYEYILDDASASVAMPTPWVPAYTPGYAPENGRALRLRGGGTFAITETHSHFKSVSLYNVSRSTKAEVGFRAAWIVH